MPLAVWAIAAALAAGVVLFAHFLPAPSAVDPSRFFNVRRLERFSGAAPARLPRVAVVGISHAMCGLYFDGELERFARDNGLPQISFVRFTKLDGTLKDFTPLLTFLERADPDVVFFESDLFLLNFRQDGGGNPVRNLLLKRTEQEENDGRKKLAAFFRKRISAVPGTTKKAPESTNDPLSEQRAIANLHGSQTDMDFERYRESKAERLRPRDFSLPEEYRSFFAVMRKRGILCILLDVPRSQKAMTVYSPEIMNELPVLIERYREVCGMRYLAFPRPLGLEYFSDFVHMNERGREMYSRWFLSQIPALLAQGGAR